MIRKLLAVLTLLFLTTACANQALFISTPPGARVPWYLLASHGFLESFPSFVPRWVRGLALEAILVVCTLLPFIDRSRSRTAEERRVANGVGALVLVLWLAFTWIGYRMEVSP